MSCDYLSKKNPHFRDKDISFVEEGHKYFLTDVPSPISVTTLIGQYFNKFDADQVLTKMFNSPNWPESKYFGMEASEIKKMWEKNGTEASELGTKLHHRIEKFFNQVEDTEGESIEFKYFLEFYRQFQAMNPEVKPYRTEWLVYDKKLSLAGSVDMLFENSKGELLILDWKRSKSIDKSNRFQKGKGIMSHLDDCNFNKYSLQLNVYRRLIESNYEKKVKGMYLSGPSSK